MRKRWKVESDFWLALAAVQVIGGLIGFLVACALTNPCDWRGCGLGSATLSLVAFVALACWMGPWVLLILSCVPLGLMALWALRPRRVTEPIHDDLREQS